MRKVALVLIACFGFFLAAAAGGPEADAGEYGKCSFNSDCHPNVKCSSGKCADSAGSSCSFDSDCGGNGAKCNSGKCSIAPDGKCSFDSECGGRKCNSGKCK
ncbi:Hypothetical protein A7982_04579 [Minicystis rosea]|nr:Hypothetical protein A7982_04579 [Minicystis rosea]